MGWWHRSVAKHLTSKHSCGFDSKHWKKTGRWEGGKRKRRVERESTRKEERRKARKEEWEKGKGKEGRLSLASAKSVFNYKGGVLVIFLHWDTTPVIYNLKEVYLGSQFLEGFNSQNAWQRTRYSDHSNQVSRVKGGAGEGHKPSQDILPSPLSRLHLPIGSHL